MQARGLWTAAALAGYAIVIVVSRHDSELSTTRFFAPWAYSAGYMVFGVSLLGAVARWWRVGSPLLWRPLMLSLGALAAALETWVRPQSDFAATPWDRWMLALLSLLVVALLARLMPRGMIHRWLGIDRRLSNT